MNHLGSDGLGPNRIECTNCGEPFDLSWTQCPHCGMDVYPLEGDEQPWEGSQDHQPPTKFGLLAHAIGLVLACGLTAIMISVLSYIFIRSLVLTQENLVAINIAISSCMLLGSLVGGYLAGRFARTRFVLHGIYVGVINSFILLPLIAREYGSLPSLVWLLLIGALSLLAGYAGARLALSQMREALVDELFTPVLDQADLYSDLLEKVRFDHRTAERLIEFERKRTPEASRVTLIQNAIRRWERDNR